MPEELAVLRRLRHAVLALSTAALGLVSCAGRGQAELKPGDLAPDFALQGSDGETWRLSDFRGKQAVVIAWFPKAFTGG